MRAKITLDQKGIIPLLVLLGLAIILTGGIAFFVKNSNESKNATPTQNVTPTPPISTTPVSPVPTSAITNSPVSAKPTIKPTAKPTSTLTPVPTTTNNSVQPTAVPTNKPTPTATPVPSPKVICEVHASTSSGTSPLSVTFTYGAAFYNTNNDYVSDVQWDFNGDGTWDTAYDTANQHPSPYTFTQFGVYYAKMHLKTHNGLESDACSTSITVN